MQGSHSVLARNHSTPHLSEPTGQLDHVILYIHKAFDHLTQVYVCMCAVIMTELMGGRGDYIRRSSTWRLRLRDLRPSAGQPAKDASLGHL